MATSQENATQENKSNIGAWNASASLSARTSPSKVELNLQRNVEQSFVLLKYDKDENRYGKVRNAIVASVGIMKAYGHGEFFGMADECTIDCVEGTWRANHGMAILSFDNADDAFRCIDTKSSLRDFQFYRDFDMYVVPLCNPAKGLHVHRYFQLDVYDVKHRQNFLEYMTKIVSFVQENHGLVVAGSEEVARYRASQNPHYVMLVQWITRSDFDKFNQCATPFLTNAGAACASRIFFRIDPGLPGGK